MGGLPSGAQRVQNHSPGPPSAQESPKVYLVMFRGPCGTVDEPRLSCMQKFTITPVLSPPLLCSSYRVVMKKSENLV